MLGDLLFGLVSIIIGVAASFGLFWLLNFLVNLLPSEIRKKARVLAFITPAAMLITLVLLYPLVQTVIYSFMDQKSKEWVGLENYAELFGDETFWGLLLNNFLWIAFVPAASVALGLLVAQLTNQVGPKREKIFKSLIFMPMAISFVSAATIWRFMYVDVADGRPEIGLFNAIRAAFGQDSVQWLLTDDFRLNSFLLMIIIVWLNVGFAMVLLSAAIKGVPEETIEAARVDGASAVQVFFRIIIPQITGTIMAVFVTILIGVMKIFDIVLAMTGGQFNTSVLGMAWYQEFFLNSQPGKAAAIVTILVILIAPLMWLQIRTVRAQEAQR